MRVPSVFRLSWCQRTMARSNERVSLHSVAEWVMRGSENESWEGKVKIYEFPRSCSVEYFVIKAPNRRVQATQIAILRLIIQSANVLGSQMNPEDTGHFAMLPLDSASLEFLITQFTDASFS